MADAAVVGPSPQVASPRDERGTPADALKAMVRSTNIPPGAGLWTALSRTVAQPRWREGQHMSGVLSFACAARKPGNAGAAQVQDSMLSPPKLMSGWANVVKLHPPGSSPRAGTLSPQSSPKARNGSVSGRLAACRRIACC